MDNLSEIEIEMVRSKDDPSQLWKREVVEEGIKYRNDWQVDFIHQEYQYLMDEDRAEEIPEYAVFGRMTVASDGSVKQAYMKNPNFDEEEITSCALRKT